MQARDLVAVVRYASMQRLRARHIDGGTYLAARIQAALPGRGTPATIIRIKHNGDVYVGNKNIGSSYGTRYLGEMLMAEKHEQRELVITADPTISGSKVERLVNGLNNGNLATINELQGSAMVFIKDYNLLHQLQQSKLPIIKVNVDLEFTDQDYANFFLFFKKNPSLLRDFQGFNPTQRSSILRLLSKNLLEGAFNFWEVMSAQAKTQMLKDLANIDPALIEQNVRNHGTYIRSRGKDNSSNIARVNGELARPRIEEITELSTLPSAQLEALAEKGTAHKANGKLGVVLLAAGAATRFGQGPKALVNVTETKSFLEIAAEDVLLASKRAGTPIPLFIMLSPANAAAVMKLMTDEGFFGLKASQVNYFYQTDVSPLIYHGNVTALALNDQGIDFAPTGHGFVVKGIQENVIPVCRELGIETLFIRNIDNLGATTRDRSFDEVLGNHLASGRGITVELARPKIGIDPITGKQVLLDQGGGAYALDGKNVLRELFAVPKELQAVTVDNPFNTLSITAQVEAFMSADPKALPWYITHKKLTISPWEALTRYQFEQVLGDLSLQIPANFVIIAREGEKGRFVPVKVPRDLAGAKEAFLAMETLKNN